MNAVSSKAQSLISHSIFKCLLLLFAFTCNMALSNSFSENYEKALNCYKAAKYSEANIHVQNALKDEPSHLPSKVLYAEIILAQGQYELAEFQLSEAKKSGADNNRLLPLYAHVYLAQRKYQRVLEILTPHTADNIMKSNMLTFHGLAYLGLKSFQQAKDSFAQALTIYPINREAMLGNAKLAIDSQDYKNAVEWSEKALALGPNDKHILLTASISYKLAQMPEQALAASERLLALEPDNLNALLTRAVLLTEQGRHQEALTDIDSIIEVIPFEPISNYIKSISALAVGDDALHQETNKHLGNIISGISDEIVEQQPVYLFLAGVVAFKQQAMVQAERALSKYHQKFPDDMSALKILARTKIALQAYGSAKSLLMKAYLVNDKDIEVISLLGRVQMLSDNLSRAEFYFEQVHTLASTELTYTVDLAKLYLYVGKYYQTIALIEPMINHLYRSDPVSMELLFLLGKAYLETKQYAQGLSLTHKLVEVVPNNSSAAYLHAKFLAFQDQLDVAITYFKKAHELDETNFLPVISLARIDVAQGQPDNAIARLTKQLEQGNNSALLIEVAEAYLAKSDANNAVIYYEKALAHNPGSEIAFTQLTRFYVAAGKLTDALAMADKFVDKNPRNDQGFQIAAQLYVQNDQPTKAVELMEKAVKLGTNKGRSLFNLAKLHLSFNQRSQAQLALKRAISWEEEYIPAYILLISIFNEDKQEAESLKYIEQLAKRSNVEFLVQRLKGDLYWSLDRLENAKRFYDVSIAIQISREAVVGLYRVYRKQEKFAEIEALLTNWLNEKPKDQMMIVLKGENYRDQGKHQIAADFYLKLVNDYPNNVVLLNNAAVTQLNTSNLVTASNLAAKAFQLAPNNVQVIDTKAWVSYHQKDYQQALTLLRKANTIDYSNAEVKYHLAATLDKLGNRAEAKVFLESALASNTPFNDYEIAKTLLASWK